jgi:catalase
VPEELVPIIPVGKLVLNRNPDNFFAETEQVAFCTAHVVPGIDFTNDPLLAGRIHSYVDTQISRLGGPNFHEIPINAPVVEVHNNQRDGMHRQTINRGRVAYEPNSLAGGCPFQAGTAGFVSFPEPVTGDAHKMRGKPERFADHYTQARLFWNSQTAVEKTHIVNAFRFELSRVQVAAVRQRMVAGLMNVAPELGEAIATGLGMRQMPEPLPKVLPEDITPEVTTSPALSLFARPGDGGVAGRRVALMVADGVAADDLRQLAAQLLAAGIVPRFIGSRLGTIEAATGEAIEVDATFETMPSVLFDAVVVPAGSDAGKRLAADGKAVEFVRDQYRHCKPMLIQGEASELLTLAGISEALRAGTVDPGLVMAPDGNASASGDAFLAALAKHRHFERETEPPVV